MSISFSERYAVCGKVDDLTIDTSQSTATSIVIKVTNNSNSVVQVTLFPTVSGGFGLNGV